MLKNTNNLSKLNVGAISGLGLGLTYMVSRAIITEWFDKNLGIASGIASTGAAFGQLALAPTIAILIVKLGIMYAFIIVGVLTGSSILFGLMLSIPTNNNKFYTKLENESTERIKSHGNIKVLELLRKPYLNIFLFHC